MEKELIWNEIGRGKKMIKAGNIEDEVREREQRRNTKNKVVFGKVTEVE